MDRILGRQRYVSLAESDPGAAYGFVDVPPGPLAALMQDFREFLDATITQPWDASRATLDYLDDRVMSLYLRGERGPETLEIQWYIQLTFSGCAGMAEVSAELAAHWAGIWYERCAAAIRAQSLEAFGFVPDEQVGVDQNRFVPVGALGYALYVGDRSWTPDEEHRGSRLFELDGASLDLLSERQALAKSRHLDEQCGPAMEDGRCRCQLCMPEYQPLPIGVLIPGM
jgi:hypothetical protein